MNLRQLEVVYAILRTGSVTEAARALNVSQPAVSIALRQSEDRLGVKLFLRRRGRLVPSAEARNLFPDVEDIFDRLSIVNRRLQDMVDSQGGSVSLCSTAAVLNSDLGHAIARYRHLYPQVRIMLRRMTSTQVMERVSRGEAEFGLAHPERAEDGLETEQLSAIEVVCGLPADHPLASKGVIEVGDLAEVSVITYSPTSLIGRPIRALFSEHGLAIRDDITVNDGPTAFHLASVGAGVALVGHFGADAYPSLTIRPFRPSITVPVVLLTRRDRPLSLNATRMIDLIRAGRRSGTLSKG